MGLVQVKTVERAKKMMPADLDRLTAIARRNGPDLAPGTRGETRALSILLQMALEHPEGFALIQKLALDTARNFLNGVMGSLSALMEDHQIAKAVVYNAGGWQSLTLFAQSLQPDQLQKRLVDLRDQETKVGKD